MITRRAFILGAGAALPLAFTSYAMAIGPRLGPQITRYAISPPDWRSPMTAVRIGVVADIHACDPWMPVERIEAIVETVNALQPDLIVLLGDFVEGLNRLYARPIAPMDWSQPLAALHAPLGVHAILGNHDWWHDILGVRRALDARALPVLENDAVLITTAGGESFWLGGLGDQLAYRRSGADDMGRLMGQVADDGRPAILLAHEPDIFPQVPERFGLTLAGHTHGGQINLPVVGRFPVASRYGQRYAYGHVVENDRHLVVSAGLGCSGMPFRFGVPPEVVLVEVGSPAALARRAAADTMPA